MFELFNIGGLLTQIKGKTLLNKYNAILLIQKKSKMCNSIFI